MMLVKAFIYFVFVSVWWQLMSPVFAQHSVIESQKSSLYAEHAELWKQAWKLRGEGKFDEAAKRAEGALRIERELNVEIIFSLRWLAEVNEDGGNWVAARKWQEEACNWTRRHRGADHWETIDARLDVKHLEKIQSLSNFELKRLRSLNALNESLEKHVAARNWSEALTVANNILEIRKKILGQNNPYYTTSLNNLGFIYKEMDDHAHALPLLQNALELNKEILGESHPEYAVSLNNLASLHRKMKQYSQAETLFVKALDVQKRARGAEHSEVAVSLNNLAECYSYMGKYRQAYGLHQQALAMWKKIPAGEDNPNYRVTLENLAKAYGDLGNYREAIHFQEQVLAIQEKEAEGGAEDLDYASSLSQLASFYRSLGDTDRAEGLYQRALTVEKDKFGSEHRNYAIRLSNLANFQESMGKYDQSERHFHQALAILIKIPGGDEHRDYAYVLSQLAGLYESTRDFKNAESYYLKAAAIQEKKLGESNPDYASALINLAGLYESMGDFASAKPLYLQGREIIKNSLGENHPIYAAVLNNLAELDGSLGDNEQAKSLHQQALEIRQNAFGEDHPELITSLINLAGLYERMGDIRQAKILYERGLEISQKHLSKEDSRFAIVLNNLANFYDVEGDHLKAVIFRQQALIIQKKILGENHPTYSVTLANLAGFYCENSAFDKAEPLYLQALEIRKRTLGEKHVDYAFCMHNLASMYHKMLDFVRAEPLYQEAVTTTRKSLGVTSLVQSERQQLAMYQNVRYQLDAYISLGLQKKQYSSRIFSQVLSWKGAALMQQRAARQAAGDPVVAENFRNLRDITSKIAVISKSVPVKAEHIEVWKTRVDELNQEKEKLEAEVIRHSSSLRLATQDVNIEQLIKSMPRDAVLIDFLEINRPYPKQVWVKELIAFVFEENAPDERRLQLISLGPMAPISDAINTWRKTYGQYQDGKAAAKLLREKIWEPLLPFINDAETILISTDGALGNLPFAVLPGKNPDTYLIEDHRIALIPVPRMLPELMKQQPDDKGALGDLLLIGDVDYTADLEQITPSDGSRAPVGKTWFPELGGTKKEIAALRNLFLETFGDVADRLMSFTREQGSEANFRNFAPQFKHLHIATHGFFAGANIPSALSGNPTHAHQIIGDRELPVVGYDPDVLSGLALAGANRRPDGDTDDGVLLSQEIAFLPMQGVDTVVLSACDTGLGKVAGGEGLLGVQRAFQVAGARTTVASYWKVDDEVTVFLMKRFYRNLWKEKMSRLDALREAQLYVLNHPAEIGKFGKRSSPKYWAAFSLSGDWR